MKQNNKKITEKILKEVDFPIERNGIFQGYILDKVEEAISLALKEKDAEIKKAIDECKEYKEVTGVMDSDGASPVISKEELKQKLNLK